MHWKLIITKFRFIRPDETNCKYIIIALLEHNMQRRHSNLGHRAMTRVVFFPRPESRGAFWAVFTHNIV